MLAHRLLSFILSGVFLMLMSCQQKPTKVMEESVDVFEPRTVLIDTRDSLQFQSYHIQGSVNLNSFDFLILKNAKTQKRILDPDLNQIIERLPRSDAARQALLDSGYALAKASSWDVVARTMFLPGIV